MDALGVSFLFLFDFSWKPLKGVEHKRMSLEAQACLIDVQSADC